MARGSVRRADRAWGYRVDAGLDPATGKRRQLSKQGFRNKRDAETALNAVLKGLEDGSTPRRSSTSLGDFLDDWLLVQKQRIRPTTWHGYEMAVERIKRHLGMAKLQALSPLQIEKFYSTLLESGRSGGGALAAKTVRNTHVVLRKALADAERLELVHRNAAGTAQAPSVQRPEHVTWSSDELKEFLSAIRSDRLYAAFVLLATTGMRRGEVLGLRWGDLDFDARELAVAHTITTAGFDQIVSGPPKTARSRRHVFLDDATLAILRDHRKRQREDRLAAGPNWDKDNDLVFRNELGGSVHPDWFSTEFDRLIRRAGIKRIRLHDLRHTYATLALKAGMHPKIVSERLGHATVGVTLDLYSHVTPSIARDAADVVASRVLD
jgi:integrase